MALSSGARTRLAKSAADNGFDLEMPAQGEWLGFASSHAPLQLWLTAVGDSLYLAAVSQQNVWQALDELGSSFMNPLPIGAYGARGVTDFVKLHRLLRRAFQLARSLPSALLDVFEQQVAALPRDTEAERLVVQRVGQDVFRGGLLDYWQGRCAISGFAVPALLRASHIKPWADCETDVQRLDVFNGFLLAPHLDAAFDCGFITVGDDGVVAVSGVLSPSENNLLGLNAHLRVHGLVQGHRDYLRWHRSRVFERTARDGTRGERGAPGGMDV